jgi:hypothetical protein
MPTIIRKRDNRRSSLPRMMLISGLCVGFFWRQLVGQLRPHVLDQFAHVVADNLDAVEFEKLFMQLLKFFLLHHAALKTARLIYASFRFHCLSGIFTNMGGWVTGSTLLF